MTQVSHEIMRTGSYCGASERVRGVMSMS
jgi:hypothetical protein